MKQSIINKLTLFCAILGGLSPIYANGQTNGKEECLRAMKDMIAHYRESKYLSFDVTYRYSRQQTPDIYLDSLKGSYRLNGNDYWYALDNTEVASYQGTCVLLFKEDHLMYLVPPNTRKKNVDFLVALDSLMQHMEGAAPILTDMTNEKKILFTFGGKTPFKSIEYSLDKSSGYITRIRQVVKSDQLYDPSIRSKIEGEVPYAIVDMDFSNYRNGAFNERQLDTGQYFKKEGQQYVTVSPYNEYQIFLGAPNL